MVANLFLNCNFPKVGFGYKSKQLADVLGFLFSGTLYVNVKAGF